MKIKAICETCNKEFEYYECQGVRGRFCSSKCAGKDKGNPKKKYRCPICSEEFWRYESIGGKIKFCTSECMAEWRSKTFIGKRNPAYGNKRPDLVEFNKRTKSELMRNRNPMQVKESAKKISGDKHWNWKGGKPSTIWLARNRGEGRRLYRRWRNDVLRRDNYTCQLCGSKNNIESTHIIPFSKSIELRFEVSNGRALCIICHSKTDPHRFLKKK